MLFEGENTEELAPHARRIVRKSDFLYLRFIYHLFGKKFVQENLSKKFECVYTCMYDIFETFGNDCLNLLSTTSLLKILSNFHFIADALKSF